MKKGMFETHQKFFAFYSIISDLKIRKKLTEIPTQCEKFHCIEKSNLFH
jgi:hypothetical protein